MKTTLQWYVSFWPVWRRSYLVYLIAAGTLHSLFSNTLNWIGSPLLSVSNLDLSGRGSRYSVKVVLSGSYLIFYLNGTQIGTLNNAVHASGKVGYAYDGQWSRSCIYDSSAWTDGSGGGSSEDYATWIHSTTLSLNTTSGGANVSNNVGDFPVLIRLNPGVFSSFSQTLAGGADIRFAKTNGTHISYQIERWVDGVYDTTEIWVKLDTVYGNNSTQGFKMY